ncbi:hypothetical protein C5C13_11565 [Clavibacter michiganensis]|nr:hypothetical protein C5C13_11565 [Clavibacter michiganensis]
MPPETTLLHDTSRSSWSGSGPRPIRARIWPSRESGPAATVLLSHGTGGAGEDLDWLARPLNDAGFLVASVDHHGNSYNDEYLVEGFTLVTERPRDMTYLLDHLVSHHDIDVDRIGCAGFSLGGYTTAALLGAEIDVRTLGALFAGHVPAPNVPEFPDLMGVLRSAYSAPELNALARLSSTSVRDPRVSAGVLLSPGIAGILTAASLAQITAPALVRWGDADDITPPEENAQVYADLMPEAEGASVGRDVGHYVFLGDRDDPTRVRDAVTTDTVAFFTRHL